mgnify:CR=1 FL=1
MGDILKKIFETIGLLCLICFSFFYTEKISTVIKENDDIQKEIEQVKDQYKTVAIDAIINNDTIIPGVSGKTIDVKASYKKMKKINSFNDNLLVYKNTKPKISVENIYDKYIISGNKTKKEISLLFLVEENDNIDKVIDILKKNNIKATFYIDGNWFENNNEKSLELIKDGHIVGNLGYNYRYDVSGISWMNTIVTKIGNQKSTYCYTENKNQDILNICKNNKSYTIIPNIVVKQNPLITIKKNLSNGSIISLKINDGLQSELPLIINYINSKDLEIVTIEKMLDE